MLAYNKAKLDSWFNRQMTEEAADLGLISETEKQAILNRIPSPFFNPRTIVRIGLGFATMVAVSMCLSFVRLVMGINSGDFIISFIFGSAVILLLEYMIRKKEHFRSGIDDMLLYQGAGVMMGGFISIFEKAPDPSIALTGLAAALALLAALRYADRLMAGLALLAFTAFTYFVVKRLNGDLWIYMPMIALAYSLIGWFTASLLTGRGHLIYYRHCFEFIQLLCLALAGIATNYFVVAEGWFYIHQQNIGGTWKWIYIATTVVVPLVTIITGFLQKDKKRIRIGALMVAAAVMTFHHYLTSTPVETLCILYGALLLIVSYWLLKHHKARENGVSFSEKHDGRDLFEIESLLISAGVGMITPQQAPERFGGGDFGGAGAGGKF
jgi:hypothetical protein